MDGQDPQVARWAAAYAALDDDALAALANRGLVRRARKDLEKAAPVIKGVEGESLHVEIEGCKVLLNAVAGKSTCSCGAGVCRHILAGIIYVKGLQGSVAAAMPAVDPAEEILKLDDEALQKWAGRALFRQAIKSAAAGELRIDSSAGVSMHLPQLNAICRWIPGGGVEGMLCSCHESGPCLHKLTAVLLLQASRGGRKIEIAVAGPQESAGAVRTRDEVRQAVHSVLHEMLDLGLSRLSAATEERLRTLSVSAHGVDLPRLERMLRALADEVRLGLQRDAQSATPNLLSSAARVWALCTALRNPLPVLVGQHRSTYTRLSGDLELIGAGAWQWQTRSGYCGLSVYFWSPAGKCWNTWSEARPVAQQFNPASRFTADGPWSGCSSPKAAAGSRVRLQNAWRNPAGRISGRASTSMLAVGEADMAAIPAIASWDALPPQVEAIHGQAFADRTEGSDLVLLSPTQWSDGSFDEVQQRAVRIALDGKNRPLPVVLHYTPQTSAGVATLQNINRELLGGVLGLLRLGPEGLFLEPITLYCKDRRIDLTLDGAVYAKPAAAGPQEQAESPEGDEADAAAEEEDESPASVSAVGQLLSGILRELENLAEGGISSCHEVAMISRYAAECDAVGLSACSLPLSRLAETWEAFRKSTRRDAAPAADAMLRSYFILHAAANLESIGWATQYLR